MEFNRKNFSNYFMIATIVFVVIWFNALYFKNRISSNHQSISEYNLSDEDIAPASSLATAAFFYPAESYQTDNDNDGYIEHKSLYTKHKPLVVIEPHYGYRRSSAVAAASYDYLRGFAQKLKNIILVGPLHQNIKGAVLPKVGSITTPLGEVQINRNIIGELQKNPLFDKNQPYPVKNSINMQLPFIANTFDKVKIVPILYGDIKIEKLVDVVSQYVSPKNLIIIVADLPAYFPLNKDEVVNGKHAKCQEVGIKTAMALARKYGLVPKLLNVESQANYKGVSFKQRGWSYKEPTEKPVLYGVELYHHNLQNFVRHHQKELLDIVKKGLSSGIDKRYKVKRKYYNDFLFNRGASLINIYRDKKLLASTGDVAATKAIAADISDNIFHALNSLSKKDLRNIAALKVSLQLLTDMEEIKFSTYEDLMEKIEYGVDGLVIRSGEREGFLPPDAWLDVKDKAEFLTKLKIKAGLSPTYWSDTTKVFRFRTVEVRDDKN